MKLLLDTHLLLWAAGDPDRLSDTARTMIAESANRLFFSSASIWEIVIKKGLGREDFRVDPVRLRKLLIANGYEELVVESDHALEVNQLPALHKDPFDRILLAQARVERMLLMTADTQILNYGDGVVSV